jgi:hypothetical protein
VFAQGIVRPRAIGTEFFAHREKIEVIGQGLDISALYGAGEAAASPQHARFLRLSPENASNLRLGGGGKWIRTLSTDCLVSKISGPIRRVIVRLSGYETLMMADGVLMPKKTCAIRNNPRTPSLAPKARDYLLSRAWPF